MARIETCGGYCKASWWALEVDLGPGMVVEVAPRMRREEFRDEIMS